MARDTSTVAVLMFDRAPLFETSVPVSVFGVDRTPSGAPAFTLLPVAAEPGVLTSTGGIELHAPYRLDALGTAGIVVVPSWRDARESPPEPALRALRQAHDEGALVVGLCMGAFVLAAAGLLDGRRAATHWFHAPVLAADHPRVQVDPAVLYVDDGDVITSAGTAAGIDACLHVVRRLWGPAAATAIARRMVTPPQRSGGQAQFIDQPVPSRPEDDELTRAMAYAVEHLDEVLDVETMSARAHLSRRTFDRRFRAEIGISPLQWLLHQRVLRAQQLLEHTDLPVDAVARHVGLASAVSLRPPFRRFAGVSPMEYRNTFRPRRDRRDPAGPGAAVRR
jgi:transcriptional regulator GlxA family with amidase domain